MTGKEFEEIKFIVWGHPQPAGSKRAMPIYRKTASGRQLVTRPNGSPIIAVTDDNPKSRDWKQQVAHAARQAYWGELIGGPLVVVLRFVRPRPAGHMGSKGLTKVGRETTAPVSRPDVLKLARGVEDALTGVVWRDDAQIVDERITKEWGEPARCEVEIMPAVPQTKELKSDAVLFERGA